MRTIVRWFGTAAWLVAAAIALWVLALLFLVAVAAGGLGNPTGYRLAGGGLLLFGTIALVVGVSNRAQGQPSPIPDGQVRCVMCGSVVPVSELCPDCGARLPD
jgi:uncharacterized membrane protein YidH (DUF202 family)